MCLSTVVMADHSSMDHGHNHDHMDHHDTINNTHTDHHDSGGMHHGMMVRSLRTLLCFVIHDKVGRYCVIVLFIYLYVCLSVRLCSG